MSIEAKKMSDDLEDLPAELLEERDDTPSLTLPDAGSFVEIELQANQLLDYINKLSNLADHACVTAIRQSESAQRIEETKNSEVTLLRKQLDENHAALQERAIAYGVLEKSSQDRIVSLETLLRQREEQLIERAAEIKSLTKQFDELRVQSTAGPEFAQKVETEVRQRLEPMYQELAEAKAQVSQRDEALQQKNQSIKKAEADFRLKLGEIDKERLEMQARLQVVETQLKDKETLIAATSVKEAEIGKLIKRLSDECEHLSRELQEKTRLLGQIDEKKPQAQPDKRVWRRVIGRLQEDPL